MTKLLQDLPAARKASAEAQAKVKAENTLLSCPFCGNANAIVYDDLLTFHAGCLSCGATGSVSSYRNGAIAAWNRRAAIAKAQGAPHE